MEEDISFLGKGWSFPPIFDLKSKNIKMVSKEEDIKQSLSIYFATQVKERVMRPNYGTILNDFVYDAVTKQKLNLLSILLKKSIRNNEPRIIVDALEIDDSKFRDGLLNIHVSYTIQSNNVRDNIVYPYYLMEGTNI